MDTHTENIIKSILNVRCREGTTIADFEVEYFDLVGVPWPFAQCSPAEIASYLNSIADVHGVIAHNGQTKWYIRSARTQHLNKLIQSQRPERTKRVPRSMVFPPYPEPSNDICNTNDWYSVQRASKREVSPPRSISSIDWSVSQMSWMDSSIDAQYLGDDFLLALESLGRKNGSAQRRSTCVPGLTIAGAIELVQSSVEFRTDRLLINVGSADIVAGANLVHMCQQLNELVCACKMRNLSPILTTLAPLVSNGKHSDRMDQKLMAFNSYINDEYMRRLPIIDIWSSMTSVCGQTIFNFYKRQSAQLGNNVQPPASWNEKGRKQVLSHIRNAMRIISGKRRVYFCS